MDTERRVPPRTCSSCNRAAPTPVRGSDRWFVCPKCGVSTTGFVESELIAPRDAVDTQIMLAAGFTRRELGLKGGE